MTAQNPWANYPFGNPYPWELAEHLGQSRVRQVSGEEIEVGQYLGDHEDWWVRARFFVNDDRLELLSLRVDPFSLQTWPPPGTPLTSPVIRSIRIEPLYRAARNALASAEQLDIDIDSDAKEFRKKPRPGPAGRPDIFYAKLASTYVDLIGQGAPTYGVARRYRISHSRARDLINEARERGLLTRTKQGQAGGQLTAKARALLDADNTKSTRKGRK